MILKMKTIMTIFTVVLVAAILIGLTFAGISAAVGQELIDVHDQPKAGDPPPDNIRKAGFMSMFEGRDPEVVKEPPPKRVCEISVKGESSWSISVLLAAAEKIDGCTVSLDLTDQSATQ